MHLPSTYSLYNKSNPARMRCMCMQSVHTRKIIGMEADRKIMNKYDDLANSDPKMVKKAAEVKALFKAQGAW